MNLIICATPLQILIAEKIMEKHPKEDFFVITYLRTSNTLKYIYYHKRIANKCLGNILLEKSQKPGHIPAYLYIIKLISIGLKIPQCKKVYISNISISDIHFILINQKKAEIITFDDGTSNIVGDKKLEEFPLRRISKLLYKSKLIPSTQELLNRQSKHYSIYTYPNNMGPSEYLPLFATRDTEVRVFKEEESILLGQPIYEREERAMEIDTAFTERVIKDYHITKYFPHPRESYHISGVEYIDTPLIIEDYLIQELKKHPERKYIIYSYCSTAVLNLQGISNQIEFVLLKPQDTPELVQEVYDLFEKLGFQITQLPYGANDLIQGQD
jgi:beta-galactoside alpha-2,3-sialyltransferase